jgi:hypothetical protein
MVATVVWLSWCALRVTVVAFNVWVVLQCAKERQSDNK